MLINEALLLVSCQLGDDRVESLCNYIIYHSVRAIAAESSSCAARVFPASSTFALPLFCTMSDLFLTSHTFEPSATGTFAAQSLDTRQ
jgi:hypothetical protein